MQLGANPAEVRTNAQTLDVCPLGYHAYRDNPAHTVMSVLVNQLMCLGCLAVHDDMAFAFEMQKRSNLMGMLNVCRNN